MKQSSELFLTFLFNSTWQTLLIFAAASLASWLFRHSPSRYRHVVWVTSLVLAFFIPLASAASGSIEQVGISNSTQVSNVLVESIQVPPARSLPATLEVPNDSSFTSSFHLNSVLAIVLIFGYLVLFGFRAFRLAQAWRSAVRIRKGASEIHPTARVISMIRYCEDLLGEPNRPVKVLSSNSLHVPVTSGLFQPVIILPEELLKEENDELLTSAIGHEYIHVARRDYFFNLVYEFLYLPLAFHPAVALIRRYIKQTRELCCDELVAQRIIKPEAYARSLVKLAGSVPNMRRLSVTTTVGIADADILEARIMSLLRKTKSDARWKRIVLVVVSLLLVVPCVSAAAFAVRLELESPDNTVVQEPVAREQEKERTEKEKVQETVKLKRQMQEVETRLAQLSQEPVTQETKQRRESEEEKLKVQAEYLKRRLSSEGEEMRAFAIEQELNEKERRMEAELNARRINQTALVRLARIQMDQAIQIATSQYPGKVLSSTLQAEGWEEPGKLSADGRVFYRVIVLPNDETNQEITHVMVNAIDGTIIKAEKELPRKIRRREPPQ